MSFERAAECEHEGGELQAQWDEVLDDRQEFGAWCLVLCAWCEGAEAEVEPGAAGGEEGDVNGQDARSPGGALRTFAWSKYTYGAGPTGFNGLRFASQWFKWASVPHRHIALCLGTNTMIQYPGARGECGWPDIGLSPACAEMW